MYKCKTFPFKEVKISWCNRLLSMGRFHRQPSTDARAHGRILEQGYREIPHLITSLVFTFHPITGKGSKSRRWQGVTGGHAMRWGKGRPRLEQNRPPKQRDKVAPRHAPRAAVRRRHDGCGRNPSRTAGDCLLRPSEGALRPHVSVGTVWFSLVLTRDKGLWFEQQEL